MQIAYNMRRGSVVGNSLFALCFCRQSAMFRRSLSHSSFHRTYSSSAKYPGPFVQYSQLIENGKLRHDPFQKRVALELEKLLGRLEQYEKDMEEYQVKLAHWKKSREDERRRLLMEEAEMKQKEDLRTSVNGRRTKLLERWIFRGKNENIEHGVGKWVSYLNREKKLDSLVGCSPTAPLSPKGLYIYGNVGSGKTMLMDMFYKATEGIVRHRRRYHFHEAMLKINEHMHRIWKKQVRDKSLKSNISCWIMNLPLDTRVKEWLATEEQYKEELHIKNILPAVADEFLVDNSTDQVGATILCFDEIQTVDVFAIVALSEIVSRLLTTGTVFVATSNRAPSDLNQDNMQHEIFQQFISKLGEHCENVLIGSDIDYRRLIAQRAADQMQVHYLWPLDGLVRKEFEKIWCKVTTQLGGEVTSVTIPVMFGRELEVPESCEGLARFSFDEICGRPVGAADYIALAENYHTIFISDIPAMSMRIRDKARRFITLIDELYNHHCCVYCLAATSIDELFQGTEEGTLFDLESFQFETETEGGKLRRNVLAEGLVGSGGPSVGIVSMLSGQEEMFAFRRAVSRLMEMQTQFYVEGVRSLHPYFQRHSEEFITNRATSSTDQTVTMRR